MYRLESIKDIHIRPSPARPWCGREKSLGSASELTIPHSAPHDASSSIPASVCIRPLGHVVTSVLLLPAELILVAFNLLFRRWESTSSFTSMWGGCDFCILYAPSAGAVYSAPRCVNAACATGCGTCWRWSNTLIQKCSLVVPCQQQFILNFCWNICKDHL
jgi:hypothetical protein